MWYQKLQACCKSALLFDSVHICRRKKRRKRRGVERKRKLNQRWWPKKITKVVYCCPVYCEAFVVVVVVVVVLCYSLLYSLGVVAADSYPSAPRFLHVHVLFCFFTLLCQYSMRRVLFTRKRKIEAIFLFSPRRCR